MKGTLLKGALFFLTLFACLTIATTASALNFNPTDVNIIADGSVSTEEWADADWEVDGLGANAGSMYAMWKNNYNIGSGNYDGTFQFLLHNIEQLASQQDHDYNVFDVYAKNDPDTLAKRIWVFNDTDNSSSTDSSWLTPAGLIDDYTEIDDRGFLVYNYETTTYAHWLPEYARPEDGAYDWDAYSGVYARGGFDNTAYTEGLPEATDNDNQIFEVILKTDSDVFDEFRRSLKDPDDVTIDSEIVEYIDAVITVVPEPISSTLFLVGAATLGFRRMRKKRVS